MSDVLANETLLTSRNASAQTPSLYYNFQVIKGKTP